MPAGLSGGVAGRGAERGKEAAPVVAASAGRRAVSGAWFSPAVPASCAAAPQVIAGLRPDCLRMISAMKRRP